MRKLLSGMVLAALALSLPAATHAQRRAAAPSMGGAKHEFGVDLGAAFGHVGSGCAANCGTFEAGNPVDVRVGFVGAKMNVEPRLTLSYLSQGGSHLLIFSPDVNFLKPMGTSTARKGLYLTAGLGISIISASGASSQNQLSLNGGVGTRIPKPSNNWRLEGFFRYNLHSGVLPSGYNVGVRAGMSFWQ